PEGLKMKVRLRKDVTRSTLVPGSAPEGDAAATGLADSASRPSHGTPALVLYGSNLGTTEDFARDLARMADLNGFDVTLAELDEYAGKLPKGGPILIACSSYNGAPPDNAAKFIDWLDNASDGAAEGISYAVFGCGHSDWAATFQATPRAIDDALERLGGTRLSDRAEGDAREDIDEQFEDWSTALWPQVAAVLDLDLSGAGEAQPLYQVERLSGTDTNPLIAQSGAQPMPILVNRELQNVEASSRSTRHIELELPEGMAYATGDHLSVIPVNSEALVGRVLRRFRFPADAQIRIQSTARDHSQLPVDQPISVTRLLSQMIELQTPASRKDVATLARYTDCPHGKPKLEALADADFKAQVQAKRLSVLDLLEEFQACELPFGVYLELMPMMTPRYYSISSSARAKGSACSITVGVVDEPAISGRGRFQGVATTFLAAQAPGAQVHASVRATSDTFHLPKDPAAPVIMVGPGTGIAPFRGFLQERATLRAEGCAMGPAMLFFGCRHPKQDYIYQEELEAYAADGLCDLHVAFSRAEKSKVYVQDLIRQERDRVWELLEAGARVFVCGDGSRMEPDVRRALTLLYSEEKDVSPEAADAWMDQMSAEGRYVLDVWVSA
ncbi:MAG: flavodoxin domain-containing protein, partial [Pseudomonadota bacterium]